jgi:superfamily II DNA or RNA helicase
MASIKKSRIFGYSVERMDSHIKKKLYMKTYKSIVKKKLLKEIFYQIEFFGKKLWMKAKKPFVLAAGTSAGKTLTSLIQLEIFYSIPENIKKITLIISSSKTILRDNFANALEEFNPSFSYYVVSNKKELEEAIKDGYQVIVVLPQTLNNNYKLLPKVTNFILDEAHQWYFKPTIQKIIKQCKPTRQLLLTGTPSRFNAKANDFEFYYVPVMDLYENDLVSNIKIEVVSSSYDLKYNDWNNDTGVLKSNKTDSPTKSKEAFKMVCDEMILKLRGRLGNKYLANLRGANKISALFNDLKKTIIFCHSLKQANAFYKELSSMKGLNDMVLLSHSENDRDSEYFEMFRTDSQYKVLVAVDRGKLGYNLPDLFNVVDFSMTQSLDMILQMMGRILRLSDKNNEKIYFKVATKNTAGYFVDLMTAALCLFKIEWYSKFNGKNMGGILIPKVKTTRPKPNGKSTPTNKKKQTQRIATLEELGIPLDLNLFNQSIMYSQGDKFSTVAWTTLDDVKREFFNINHKGIGYWTKEKCTEEAKKYKTRVDFMQNSMVAYQKSRDEYNFLDEICKHMPPPLTKWNYDLALKTAKKYKSRNELKLAEQTCWQWIKRNKLDDIMFAHMKNNITTYNLEELKEEAIQFEYREDWKNFNPKGYSKVTKEGLLNEYCKHMYKTKFHNIKFIENILKKNKITSLSQLKSYDKNLYYGLYRAKTLNKFSLLRTASNQFICKD